MKTIRKRILTTTLLTGILSLTACSDPCVKYDELSAMGESFELRPDAQEIRDACMNKVLSKLVDMTEVDGTKWMTKQTQWKYGGQMTKYRLDSERIMEELNYMATSNEAFAYRWTPKEGTSLIRNLVLGPSTYDYAEITSATVVRKGENKFHVIVMGNFKSTSKQLSDLTKIAVFPPMQQYLKKNTREQARQLLCKVNGHVSSTVADGDHFVCRYSMRAEIDPNAITSMRTHKTDEEVMQTIFESTLIVNDKNPMYKGYFGAGQFSSELTDWREFLKIAEFGTVLQ